MRAVGNAETEAEPSGRKPGGEGGGRGGLEGAFRRRFLLGESSPLSDEAEERRRFRPDREKTTKSLAFAAFPSRFQSAINSFVTT